MKRKLLLIGAGGHCKVILDLLLKYQEYEVVGIIDLKKRLGDNIFGVKVIGTDADIPKFFKKGIRHCFITIGSVGDPSLRIKMYNIACKSRFVFPNLIHPLAMVSSCASLGTGNYIAPGVIINAGTRIGDNCIINTGSVIEHDCLIGDFVHIASGVILSGDVSVKSNAHLGTGSAVIQGVNIGMNTIIGAGSVVVKDIKPNCLAFGNPCKFIKKNA